MNYDVTNILVSQAINDGLVAHCFRIAALATDGFGVLGKFMSAALSQPEDNRDR